MVGWQRWGHQLVWMGWQSIWIVGVPACVISKLKINSSVYGHMCTHQELKTSLLHEKLTNEDNSKGLFSTKK